MIFTRFLKVAGYLLAVLCLFGIATQIAQFGRPLGREHQLAVDAWRKSFSDILQHSHLTPEASQQLAASYEELLDERERLLKISSRFMAGACTVVAGLLSASLLLWCRVRVLAAMTREPGAGAD
jgi:hypothetical protein